MQSPPTATTPRRLDPWPTSIIAFFIIAILGCGTFVAFCSRHPADLITPDYYEEEVRYQGQMERLQHGQQASQAASITYDTSANRITISVPSSRSSSRLAGEIQLYRPSSAKLDRRLKLEVNPQGVQTFDAAGLLPGLWKVRLSWTLDEREYLLEQKIIIPPKPA